MPCPRTPARLTLAWAFLAAPLLFPAAAGAQYFDPDGGYQPPFADHYYAPPAVSYSAGPGSAFLTPAFPPPGLVHAPPRYSFYTPSRVTDTVATPAGVVNTTTFYGHTPLPVYGPGSVSFYTPPAAVTTELTTRYPTPLVPPPTYEPQAYYFSPRYFRY